MSKYSHASRFNQSRQMTNDSSGNKIKPDWGIYFFTRTTKFTGRIILEFFVKQYSRACPPAPPFPPLDTMVTQKYVLSQQLLFQFLLTCHRVCRESSEGRAEERWVLNEPVMNHCCRCWMGYYMGEWVWRSSMGPVRVGVPTHQLFCRRRSRRWCTDLSMFLRRSDTCTLPLTMRAQAR